ncbi:FAD-binding oxidoreductase [Rhodococcus sp. ARP2]|uniref:FAD-binding oxidoreductase n=1 Tax=Rhodococcus sp. ARP2 TaxID=1661385 RepID=UPI00064BA84E|nr:FAD-binding oxidoreductase [Rhodococcus sp. ARP2]
MSPRTLVEAREPATDARFLGALAEIVGALAEIVGEAHVLTDPELIEGYTRDWTGRWIGDAIAVVRPADTAEVSAVVTTCFEAGIPITPQGGNTGLVGGGIPSAGSVVLSTRRLDSIETVDPIGRTIAAGAGVTVARADLAASAHGLRFGIDLASKESATLGGIVATNAGGTRMVRYGNTRAQILGIEAVLADGSVLSRWTPLVKDNVGYDIPGLLAGSEGTLAIVTKVLMKLVTPATDTQVVLAGVRDVDQALHLCNRVRQSGLTVEAAEIMTDDGISLVCAHTDARRPFGTPSPMYTLIEVSSPRETEESLLEVLSASADLIEDATVEPGPARKLWTLRESHTESISASSTTPVVKLDISVPLSVMGMFIERLREVLTERFVHVRPMLFGHFADGNIHVNLLDAEPNIAHELTDTVFELVSAHHGSISAEHGIGRAKSPWIALGRTETDIAAMKLIKSSWDPRGILNPGILLPETVG